ncbi:hypothetical protein ACPOL_3458 [Acidisarcina polymorpha]|uniref:Uncharacterized protein n=1 Tax=Acidisarcina polymorpha TaxID=2211140 RepID=A0A2Z5G0Q3_9BACT|nr:hypothetical protein ACPOL_3458 [Acidisarcina polymorpha]
MVEEVELKFEMIARDYVNCSQLAVYFSDDTMAIFTAKQLASFSLDRLEAEEIAPE